LIIPAAVAIFSAAQGSVGGLLIAGLIFFPTLMFSVIRYLTLRYRIEFGELVVTEGLIFRRIRTVPVSRIQNVDLVQNLLHRMFGVAEVRVETASGKEPEATLRVLSLPQVELLRNSIFTGRTAFSTASENELADDFEHSPPSVWAQPQSQILLQIPTSWLLKAGLASDKGMILVGILIGAIFQFDIEDRFDLRDLIKLLPNFGLVWNWIWLAVGFILVLLLLRIFGAIWFVLRFHGYRLARQGDDLRIACGLITKVSATVPRRRIQLISVHRNLIMRFWGMAAIRIETAGATGGNHEDATKAVSSRWFVPVIPESRVREILDQLRKGLGWSDRDLVWHAVSPRTWVRLSRLSVLISLVVGLIGLAISRPWGWVAGVVALPFLIWHANRSSRAMRYARIPNGVVYRSGVLTKKMSVTFYEKIQSLRVEQSPFDRRWRMATLSVDTAGSGPAEHAISISYLPQEFAISEHEYLLDKASRHEPVFA
jgi:putative membrane protein